MINPISPFNILYVLCMTGALGQDCKPVDAKCMIPYNMMKCHRDNFGSIHTPEYLESLKRGSNPKPRKP